MIRDINYLQYISSFKSVNFDAHHCLSEACWVKFKRYKKQLKSCSFLCGNNMFMACSCFASIKGTATSLTAYWRSIHFFLFTGNIGLMKKRFMFSTFKSGASRIHVKPCHSPRDCFHERESRRIRLHVQMRFWERFQFVQSCITLFTGRLQNEPMFSGEVSFRSKLDVENRFKKKM